jgi:photosystem II stability/assembly factor-like uncharacterized protein
MFWHRPDRTGARRETRGGFARAGRSVKPSRAYAVGFDGKLYRSDDRGQTWNEVS